MQSILEKAYNTLANENMATATTNFKTIGSQAIPEMGGVMNFPPFQDLNICGNNGEEQNEGFMTNNESLFVGKKRPNPYNGSGKSPLIWNDDLRLHDLGMASDPQDVAFKGDQIQIAPPSIEASDPPSIDASIKLGRVQNERMSPMINVAQGRSSPFG